MIEYILGGLLLMISIALAGAMLLVYMDDESGKSILYDDPEYFDGEQPKWLRQEEGEEDDET